MFYIIKSTDVDDVEILGAYSKLDKAKRYLVKAANKAARGSRLIQSSDWGRMYEDCTVRIGDDSDF